MSNDEVLNDFPELTQDKIQACLVCAAQREHQLA